MANYTIYPYGISAVSPAEGSILNTAAREAIVSTLEKVAWVNVHGQDYLDYLEEVLVLRQTPPVPAYYDAEVEYLYSDGNQYIDLQWDGNSATDAFGIEYRIPSPIANARFFNGDTAGPNIYVNSSKVLAYSSNWSDWRATNMGCGTDVKRKYKVDFYNKTYQIDSGNPGTLSNDSTAISTNMVLCGPMGSNPQFVGYIYNAQIWREDVLSADLIPVRIGQVGYMYDRVRNLLLPNAGTGSFTIGADITE